MRIIILLSFLCCILISCSDTVTSTVTGGWTIDTLIYNGTDFKNCLLHNSLYFEEEVEFPIPENICSDIISEYTRKGKWEIEKSSKLPLSLRIESKNRIFNGLHKIVFRDDKINEVLKMELISRRLHVVCRKKMFNYDNNQRLINDLVLLSKSR